MKHRFYLALDIGTTNWKAAIFDELGKLHDIERCPTVTHTEECGYSFYNPEELWQSFGKIIKTLIKRTDVDIEAISVASVGEAVVPVDKNGNALDNIMTWYDTRACSEADELKKKFGDAGFYSITGLDINPIFSLPKIMWVYRNRPEVTGCVFKWLQIADFILMKLCGETVTDYTLASRTLAFDLKKNDWSDDILEYTGLNRELFPSVREAGTVIGNVLPCVCEEFGFRNRPKVVVGGHDHPCGTVVTGAIKGKKIHDSSGTAEAYILISDKNQNPVLEFRGQRTCRHLRKDRFLTICGIVSSGISFDWAYRLLTGSECFGIKSEKALYENILPQLDGIKAAEQGLLFYPHLRGAGAPYWDPKQSGSFIGIRDCFDNRHFLKAVLEGLCFQSRLLIETEEKITGLKTDSICVVGGSSRNRIWQQLKADITQKNVELCFEPEATALGAAMLAAMGDGVYGSLEEIADVLSVENEILVPRKKTAGLYDGWYEIFRDGYDALESVNRRIHSLYSDPLRT